jgi:hypothetical protein
MHEVTDKDEGVCRLVTYTYQKHQIPTHHKDFSRVGHNCTLLIAACFSGATNSGHLDFPLLLNSSLLVWQT